MQPWVWLIIIIIVILVVWWLLSRSARQHEANFDIHHEEETHAPAIEEVEPAAPVVRTAPAEELVVSAAKVAPPKPDDLVSLEGIGPKVNSLLQTAGITTFAQLAITEISRLKEILAANDLQFIDPSSWPEQAKLAAEGKSEELKALQDRLKGGRKVN